MYRECDNCKGIFRLTKIILERFNLDKTIKIYCPYCNTLSHHQTNKKSERGYIK